MHYYKRTVSTRFQQAKKCFACHLFPFTPQKYEDLVFIRDQSIEIVWVKETGEIQSILHQSVHGTILDAAPLYLSKYSLPCDTMEGHGQAESDIHWPFDAIACLSDQHRLVIVGYDPQYHRFTTLHSFDLSGGPLNHLASDPAPFSSSSSLLPSLSASENYQRTSFTQLWAHPKAHYLALAGLQSAFLVLRVELQRVPVSSGPAHALLSLRLHVAHRLSLPRFSFLHAAYLCRAPALERPQVWVLGFDAQKGQHGVFSLDLARQEPLVIEIQWTGPERGQCPLGLVALDGWDRPLVVWEHAVSFLQEKERVYHGEGEGGGERQSGKECVPVGWHELDPFPASSALPLPPLITSFQVLPPHPHIHLHLPSPLLLLHFACGALCALCLPAHAPTAAADGDPFSFHAFRTRVTYGAHSACECERACEVRRSQCMCVLPWRDSRAEDQGGASSPLWRYLAVLPGDLCTGQLVPLEVAPLSSAVSLESAAQSAPALQVEIGEFINGASCSPLLNASPVLDTQVVRRDGATEILCACNHEPHGTLRVWTPGVAADITSCSTGKRLQGVKQFWVLPPGAPCDEQEPIELQQCDLIFFSFADASRALIQPAQSTEMRDFTEPLSLIDNMSTLHAARVHGCLIQIVECGVHVHQFRDSFSTFSVANPLLRPAHPGSAADYAAAYLSCSPSERSAQPHLTRGAVGPVTVNRGDSGKSVLIAVAGPFQDGTTPRTERISLLCLNFTEREPRLATLDCVDLPPDEVASCLCLPGVCPIQLLVGSYSHKASYLRVYAHDSGVLHCIACLENLVPLPPPFTPSPDLPASPVHAFHIPHSLACTVQAPLGMTHRLPTHTHANNFTEPPSEEAAEDTMEGMELEEEPSSVEAQILREIEMMQRRWEVLIGTRDGLLVRVALPSFSSELAVWPQKRRLLPLKVIRQHTVGVQPVNLAVLRDSGASPCVLVQSDTVHVFHAVGDHMALDTLPTLPGVRCVSPTCPSDPRHSLSALRACDGEDGTWLPPPTSCFAFLATNTAGGQSLAYAHLPCLVTPELLLETQQHAASASAAASPDSTVATKPSPCIFVPAKQQHPAQSPQPLLNDPLLCARVSDTLVQTKCIPVPGTPRRILYLKEIDAVALSSASPASTPCLSIVDLNTHHVESTQVEAIAYSMTALPQPQPQSLSNPNALFSVGFAAPPRVLSTLPTPPGTPASALSVPLSEPLQPSPPTHPTGTPSPHESPAVMEAEEPVDMLGEEEEGRGEGEGEGGPPECVPGTECFGAKYAEPNLKDDGRVAVYRVSKSTPGQGSVFQLMRTHSITAQRGVPRALLPYMERYLMYSSYDRLYCFDLMTSAVRFLCSFRFCILALSLKVMTAPPPNTPSLLPPHSTPTSPPTQIHHALLVSTQFDGHFTFHLTHTRTPAAPPHPADESPLLPDSRTGELSSPGTASFHRGRDADGDEERDAESERVVGSPRWTREGSVYTVQLGRSNGEGEQCEVCLRLDAVDTQPRMLNATCPARENHLLSADIDGNVSLLRTAQAEGHCFNTNGNEAPTIAPAIFKCFGILPLRDRVTAIQPLPCPSSSSSALHLVTTTQGGVYLIASDDEPAAPCSTLGEAGPHDALIHPSQVQPPPLIGYLSYLGRAGTGVYGARFAGGPSRGDAPFTDRLLTDEEITPHVGDLALPPSQREIPSLSPSLQYPLLWTASMNLRAAIERQGTCPPPLFSDEALQSSPSSPLLPTHPSTPTHADAHASTTRSEPMHVEGEGREEGEDGLIALDADSTIGFAERSWIVRHYIMQLCLVKEELVPGHLFELPRGTDVHSTSLQRRLPVLESYLRKALENDRAMTEDAEHVCELTRCSSNVREGQ